MDIDIALYMYLLLAKEERKDARQGGGGGGEWEGSSVRPVMFVWG